MSSLSILRWRNETSMRTKVLFVIESLSGGGAEKVLSVLLKHIDKTKFDITLCTVVDTGVYVEEVKKYVRYTTIIGNPIQKTLGGKLWYQIKYKCVYNLLPMKWIYQLFVPKNNDVEVAFVEGFTTKLMAASTNKKAKKIAWVHTDLINNHWINVVYNNESEEKDSYNKYNTVIGVSNVVTNSIQKLYNVKHAITLYNPIESDLIKRQSEVPIKLPVKTKSLRMISLGRFVIQKAYDRLLRIVKRLHEEGYSIELWLLGDGEQHPILENYIQANSLDSIVTLWGFHKNPYPYLKNSDLFVCSSISEGYSTAVTEALIVGLPVVTTDCSGMNELLREGKCGLITENNEEELYLGIKKCLDNPDLLIQYRKEVMLRNKDFEINQLMSHIEKVLIS